MKKGFYSLILTLTFGSALSASAAATATLSSADFSNARCFEFDDQVSQSLEELEFPQIIGCYLVKNRNFQLSFLKDGEGLKNESAVWLELKKLEPYRLTHFSLVRGKTQKVTQSPVEVNPLPIPLTLQEAIASGAREVSTLDIYSDELREQANDFIRQLSRKSMNSIFVSGLMPKFDNNNKSISSAGKHFLSEEEQPKDGFWWPQTSYPLARGSNSPLAKYDAYVQSISGENPGSQAWEQRYHYTDTNWAGHCNGWVSSSILYGYYPNFLRDEVNGNIITSSDIQGLRAASSFCAQTTSVGRRYYGPESDVNDIDPLDFHKNLTYYVKYLRKPVAMDYKTLEPVDNHIISGYEFTYEPTNVKNMFVVNARIRAHQYNFNYVRVKQVAKPYIKNYKYFIWMNDTGKIIRAQWAQPNDHPDFIWIPLAQSNCSGENPNINPTLIDYMIEKLEKLPTEERDDLIAAELAREEDERRQAEEAREQNSN